MLSDILIAISLVLFVVWWTRTSGSRSVVQHADAYGPLVIYYASQSGTASRLASLLADSLKDLLIKAVVRNIKDFRVD